MSAISGISQSDLAQLLATRFKVDAEKGAEIETVLNARLNLPRAEPDQQYRAIQAELYDLFASIIAGRLLEGNLDIPLLSYEDVGVLMESKIRNLAESKYSESHDGETLSADEAIDRESRIAGMVGMIEGMFSEMSKAFLHGDPYKDHWRWVGIVIDISNELSLPPFQVVAGGKFSDEITRRMYSKDEYSQLMSRVGESFLGEDSFKRISRKVVIGALGFEPPEEFIESCLSDVMPEIMATINPAREALSDYMDKETERIYSFTE